MHGFSIDIEKTSKEGKDFRKVLYTARHCQLVLMSLQPKEDIGMEVHEDNDQFIRCESGIGKTIINGEEHEFSDGYAVVIPAGSEHNIVNTGETSMQLYTLYSPPHHADGTVHATKADA